MHRVFTTFILLSLIACSADAPFESRTTAFGQPLLLEIDGVPTEKAQVEADDIFADLHYISDAAHPWSAGALGRTNQLLKMTAKFSANPSVLPLIAAAQRLEKETHGYYAPALGGLQQLWGFHSELPDGPVPEATSIKELLAAKPAMSDVRVNGIVIDNNNPSVRIDFGPMAKGYALDVALQRLRDAKITHAKLVNGNMLAVVGAGWNAKLANGQSLPLRDGEVEITLERDEHAYTLGDKSYHPYLDPFTGYPSSGLLSVSVIHSRGADAAAFAQALLSGGRGKLEELLRVIPVKYALAVTDEGEIILSDGLKRRLGTVQQ
jgi:FAD:protein FMN transferase